MVEIPDVWEEIWEEEGDKLPQLYEEMELYNEARVLAKFWIHNLNQLAIFHPRVVKKVRENIKKWAGVENEEKAFTKLAEELLKRRQKRPQLQSVKIALTYSYYICHAYGSCVKLYANGSVVYRDHACYKDLAFIIHDGEEVA